MFNADDLPVRGFIARVALHREDSGGVLVNLVDRLIQGRAPGYAADRARLLSLLGAAEEGEESTPGPGPEQLETEVDIALAQLNGEDPELVARIAIAVAQQDDAESGEEGFSLGDARRAVKWAKLFGRSRVDLPADYVHTFGEAIHLCVPILVDLGTGLVDQPQTTLRQQVDLFELISRASMLDALPRINHMRIHPFVGFDPLRELRARRAHEIDTPLAIVRDAVERYGFIGVKVYPQMGWRPSGNRARPGLSKQDAEELDSIVDELAAWCETEDVPITAHGNDSNYASPRYAGFGEPAQWFAVLDRHPRLHLNLGHFGGVHLEAGDYVWARAIAAGMTKYPHLYADVGCHRVDQPEVLDAFFTVLAALAREPDTAHVTERLMFGTDWYMEAINPDADQFLSIYRQRYLKAFGEQSTQRFLAENALAFLGLRPGNANRRRLVARYEAHNINIPDWLNRDPLRRHPATGLQSP
jgi:predicted TIM-barrel fold metal-dependent hydrolase